MAQLDDGGGVDRDGTAAAAANAAANADADSDMDANADADADSEARASARQEGAKCMIDRTPTSDMMQFVASTMDLHGFSVPGLNSGVSSSTISASTAAGSRKSSGPEESRPAGAAPGAEAEGEDVVAHWEDAGEEAVLVVRPTLGWNCSMRLRTVLITAFSVLLLAFVLAVVVPTSRELVHVQVASQNATNTSTVELSNKSLGLVQDLVHQTTQALLVSVNAALARGLFESAQAVLLAVANTLAILQLRQPGFTGEMSPVALPLNETSVAELERLWAASIGPALFPAVREPLFAGVENIRAGYKSGSVLLVLLDDGHAEGFSNFYDVTPYAKELGSANGTLVFTLGNSVPYCTFIDPVTTLPGFGNLTEVGVAAGEPEDMFMHPPCQLSRAPSRQVDMAAWFQAQEGMALDEPLHFVWTDLNVLWTGPFQGGGSGGGDGDPDDPPGPGGATPDHNPMGISLTYPIAPCGNYSCVEGVLAVDIETSLLDLFTHTQLTYALASDCEGRADEPRCQQDRRVLFLARWNHTDGLGTVIGNSLNAALDRDPNRTFPALTHPDALIRLSSGYLEQEGLLDLGVNNSVVFLRMPGDGDGDGDGDGGDPGNTKPPTCSVGEILVNGSRPTLNTDRTENCFAVVFGLAEAEALGSNGPLLTLATVAVIPVNAFFRDVPESIDRVLEELEEAGQDIDKEILQLGTRNYVLAAFFLLCGIGLAVLVAALVDRPLSRLRLQLRDVNEFRFRECESDAWGAEWRQDDTLVVYGSRLEEVFAVEQTLRTTRSTLETFARFVPREVVRNVVVDKGKSRRLHVERREVTILFSDIAGFTSISEAMDSKMVLIMITKYLTVMTHVIESYGGVVTEILGDGVLAFWSTPHKQEHHAALACAAALAQQMCMPALNSEFGPALAAHGLPPLSIRVGIHTGQVLSGNIGSVSKMKFGCVGNAVNLASRIEGICKLYGAQVLCTSDTFGQLPTGCFEALELDTVRVKGKKEPTKLYQVLSMPGTLEVCITAGGQASEGAPESPSANTWACNCGTGCCATKHHNNTDAGAGDGEAPHSTEEHQAGDATSRKRRRWLPLLPDAALLPRLASATTNKSPRAARCEPPGKPDCKAGHSGGPRIVVGPVGDTSSQRAAKLQCYEKALRAYQSGDFAAAAEALREIEPATAASAFLAQRVVAAAEAPAKDDWDGVLNLVDKSF